MRALLVSAVLLCFPIVACGADDDPVDTNAQDEQGEATAPKATEPAPPKPVTTITFQGAGKKN